MHPTVVPENYSSSGILIILIKVQTVCINRNNFACKFTHIVSKKTQINITENPPYCHRHFSLPLVRATTVKFCITTIFFSYSKHIEHNSENIDLQVDHVLSAIYEW